ncbi:MAG: helix-turn-helix domain-containing protein [Saprospiraceae bacterium]|nr:helix-turn-helix domain-containing protein [Saprospiraceae bacterium]
MAMRVSLRHIGQIVVRLNEWINGLLAYPGITPQALMRKKIYWIACVTLIFGLMGMTMLTHLMGLKILALYGLVLLGWYTLLVLSFCLIKRNLDWLGLLTSLFVILLNFVFTLKLGGTLHSGGIIFASLSALLFTVIFQNIRWSIITFLVFGASVLGIWALQPQLRVPPEMTPAANQMVFVLNILWISAFTIAFVVYFIYQSIFYEKEETKRLQELDDVKTKLYANITHEFRTPLTLILGMADQMEAAPKTWLKEGAASIRRNSNHLLHLVNQMLDLSKLESGALSVHLIQSDIVFYLKYLLESFRSGAAGKKLTLQFLSNKDHFLMDYDAEKLLHIVSNLLMNALKFTPEGGKITLSVTANEANKKLDIRVKDTGVGISAEALPYIFDRFFSDGGDATPGTGLGLTLTRELVKLLGGSLDVQSEQGKGAEFRVQLPVWNNAPLEETQLFDLVPNLETLPGDALPPPMHHKRLANLPLLLIVEDHQEVIHYLMSLLGKAYHIEFALNGASGLEKALTIIPDIIICDVMMPVMDGFALLENLKKDQRTSHIPVVMLTAKADVASRLSGLERGADAFIAKPFHQTELLVELKKLIGLRKVLQARYSSTEPPPPSTDKAVQQEDAFMQKVREVLEANVSDEDFGIPQLCKALAMSRAQLYRKFDALTDLPVHQYMRNLRLRKAKTLLETTDLNVTEVALEVGFKNLSHFSRSFSEEFGVSPSSMKH